MLLFLIELREQTERFREGEDPRAHSKLVAEPRLKLHYDLVSFLLLHPVF